MRRVFTWVLRIVAGLVALVVLAIVAIFALSEGKIRRTFTFPDEAITVPTDAESIANGKRLTLLRGCVDCHGENMAGKIYLDDPMLGTIYAANLTNGGAGATLGDADWIRAIRHGVGPDGRALWVMPSNEFNGLSAEDIGDMIAYSRSLPPVESDAVANRAGPMGRFALATGALPIFAVDSIDHSKPMPAQVQAEPSQAYGEYLTATCHGCHGPGLGGGPLPGAQPGDPEAANLTPGGDLQGWQEADFVRAIREGKRPDGSVISDKMPWKYLGQSYTDDDLHAVWLYLQGLPPSSTTSN